MNNHHDNRSQGLSSHRSSAFTDNNKRVSGLKGRVSGIVRPPNSNA